MADGAKGKLDSGSCHMAANGTDEPVCRNRNRGADGENRRVDTERGRELGTNWEKYLHIYSIMCETERERLPYSTGYSARGSVMTYKGGMRVVGGRLKSQVMYVYIKLIHVVQRKLTHCKAIILQ